MISARDFEPLLTKQDLAIRFQVCQRTIEIWVGRGWLPAPMYLHKRAPRWGPDVIRAWEQRNAPRLRLPSLAENSSPARN